MRTKVVDLDGKKISIPLEDIKRSMETLSITEQEAISVWLEDEGYLDNEEQNALEEKAKKNRITATIHQAKSTEVKKKTIKERVQKDDPTKEEIIAKIAEMLENMVENVEIVNKTKLISFTLGEESFKIDLIRHRKPKEKKIKVKKYQKT